MGKIKVQWESAGKGVIMMKFSRYLILTAAALLSLASPSGMHDGPLAQFQSACTVTVQPSQSIQVAIDQAAEDDVICLAEGTWEENIKIEKSLTLRGASQEQTVIDGVREGYPVVWIAASEGTQTVSVEIAGLTITGAIGTGRMGWGCADGDDNDNERICPGGILIRGPAQVEIVDSVISNNGVDPYGYGLKLRGRAKASITGSTIRGNAHGIELWGLAEMKIRDTTISWARWGIEPWGSSRVEIATATISGMRTGLWVRETARARITNTTISETSWYGIEVWDSGQVEASDNLIEGNYGCGIAAWGGEVRGRGNRMSDNGADLCGSLSGELRLPLAEPTAEEIIFPSERYESLQEAIDALMPDGRIILAEGEHPAGVTIAKAITIEAVERAEVVLKGRSERYAPVLSLVGGADLTLKGIEVTGGGTGLALGADAETKITDSIITWNYWVGIGAGGRAKVEVATSTIFKNGFLGISLSGSAQAKITDTTISGNDYRGISLEDSAQAEITGSTIFRNASGISLGGRARLAITRSTIIESALDGITLGDSAQAEISDSLVSGNATGILLLNSVQAKIERNTIINNEGYGVALSIRGYGSSPAPEPPTGHVSGCGNAIPDKDEPEGNKKGDVYPEELSFLKEPCDAMESIHNAFVVQKASPSSQEQGQPRQRSPSFLPVVTASQAHLWCINLRTAKHPF